MDTHGHGAMLLKQWLNSELYNQTDVDDLVEFLILERDTAITRAEKAEADQEDLVRTVRMYQAEAVSAATWKERAEKVEAERDKAWADMDRLRVGADAEITKLEEQRDRARQQLVYLRSVSHECDIKHIDAAIADEPPTENEGVK